MTLGEKCSAGINNTGLITSFELRKFILDENLALYRAAK